MLINYLAGAVSLVLAISVFAPWITVWFYSLKGIESSFGIGVLIVGILGVSVAIFQHLAGKIRGRAYALLSLVALTCEILYIKKMVEVGKTIEKIIKLAYEFVGKFLIDKASQKLGPNWVEKFTSVMNILEIDTSVSGFDFVGGGLLLAVFSALILLILGIIIETKKPAVD